MPCPSGFGLCLFACLLTSSGMSKLGSPNGSVGISVQGQGPWPELHPRTYVTKGGNRQVVL